MRQSLPHRRPNFTTEAEFKGHSLSITVGYDLEGQPREVFANTQHSGSDMQASLADACVLVSVALQYGVPPEALGRSLGRVPTFSGGAIAEGPASPLGVILGALTNV